MTKYIVFGWAEGTDRKSEPLDVLHGTMTGVVEEDDPRHHHEDGSSIFGLGYVDKEMTLADNLMGGKAFPMHVLYNYSENQKVEEGRPVLAFYAIPDTESVNG